MEKSNLEWEITSQEAKTRTLQSITVVANILAGLAVILAIKEKSWMVIFVFAGILLIFYIFTFIFAKFKSRKFNINETGITISKGSKQKTYAWNDFECFVTHSMVVNRSTKGVKDASARVTASDIIAASDKLTDISGKTFYLKKKKQGFWDKFIKTFVVVYAEPDNSELVGQALAEYLTNKPLDNSTEAGLVKYEFR